MGNSRSEKLVVNITYGILSKIITLVLSFISRTLFINYLGPVYLGINGLYSDILNFLSLTELGIGSALTYAMYEPIARNDDRKLVQILDYYRKVYRIIAGAVIAIGLCTFPFLQDIVKGASNISLDELRIYYILYLINNVSTYFVAYKKNLVIAKLEDYVITRFDIITNFITVILQIIVLKIYPDFLFYLSLQIFISVLSKAILSVYLNKKYSIFHLKSNEELSSAEKIDIFKNVKGLAISQFSSVAIYSTDSIIISMLTGAGVVAIGYISNYNMLINSVLAFLSIIFNSLTPAFGNIAASSSKSLFLQKFKEISLISVWIFGVVSICFFILIPKFIYLWLGEKYIIDNIVFLLIVINVYMQGQTTAFSSARFACGNFNKDKIIPFCQAIINLVVSVILAKNYGIVGVFIGTIVSRIFFWIGRSYIMYPIMFDTSVLNYYIYSFRYLTFTFVIGYIVLLLNEVLFFNISIVNFFFCGIFTFFATNMLFCIVLFRTEEYKLVYIRIKILVEKIIKKKRGNGNDNR